MKIYRYEENPLLTPAHIEPYHDNFEVIGVFNAGVTEYHGETLLLLRIAERPISDNPNLVKVPIYNCDTKKIDIIELSKDDLTYDFSDPRTISLKDDNRVQYLTSISYLRLARSQDGRYFTVDKEPFVYPMNKHEIFGIEDPRITKIDDTFYICFTAVSPHGVGVSMISTKNFIDIEHHGLIFSPENKDVAIFPEKINGKYYALHRPVPNSIGGPEVWIAESENLLHWGNHQFLFGLRDNMWDNGRIGAGAVPIKTDRGWLELYHGADKNNRYCMGAVLLDLENPTKVMARSKKPILEPEAPYEVEGFFGNVVFSCGVLVDGDTIKMYYGVADTSIACAELSLQEILNSLK